MRVEYICGYTFWGRIIFHVCLESRINTYITSMICPTARNLVFNIFLI